MIHLFRLAGPKKIGITRPLGNNAKGMRKSFPTKVLEFGMIRIAPGKEETVVESD